MPEGKDMSGRSLHGTVVGLVWRLLEEVEVVGAVPALLLEHH